MKKDVKQKIRDSAIAMCINIIDYVELTISNIERLSDKDFNQEQILLAILSLLAECNNKKSFIL